MKSIFFAFILFAITASAQEKWQSLVASANKKMGIQDYKGALEDLDNAIDDCPKCSTPYFRKVMALAELKEFDKAQKALKKGKEYSAESRMHYYYTAYLQWKQGEKERTLLTLQEFFDKDSTSALAASMYEIRAGIRLVQKLYDDAYADNLRAIKIQPKNYHALASVIIHEIHSKDTEKANQRIAAIQLTDSSKSYVYNYELGHIFFTLNRFEDALPYFERALEINQRSIPALGFVAITKARLKRYEEALKDMNTLTQVSPKNASGWNNIGFIKINQGLYEEALVYLEKAIELDPNAYDAYNNRGYVYFKKGGKENLVKALADYDKAISVAPYYYEPFWKYKELIAF